MDNPQPIERPSGPLIFIMGPTASGKTQTAIAVAQAIGSEILNADSAQVYRPLTIGAAKPTLEERTAVPHHLIDVADIADPFSAGRFQRLALPVIERLHAHGRIPLVAGGTGLYFRALEQGLAHIPPVDPGIFAALGQEGEERGWPALHAELQQVDAKWAMGVSVNDKQRIRRGLAVFRSSGKPLTHWHLHQPIQPAFTLLKLALMRPLEELYQRIDARFEAMMAAGFLDEVKGLLAQGHDRDAPAMKAVGYRQLMAALDGDMTLEQAVEAGKRESRRYARRQLTWLRGEKNLVSVRNIAHAVEQALDFARFHAINPPAVIS